MKYEQDKRDPRSYLTLTLPAPRDATGASRALLQALLSNVQHNQHSPTHPCRCYPSTPIGCATRADQVHRGSSRRARRQRKEVPGSKPGFSSFFFFFFSPLLFLPPPFPPSLPPCLVGGGGWVGLVCCFRVCGLVGLVGGVVLVGLGGAGVVVGVVVWLVWWQLGLVAPARTEDKSPRVSHAEGVSNPCTVSAAARAARTREMIVVARAVPSSL